MGKVGSTGSTDLSKLLYQLNQSVVLFFSAVEKKLLVKTYMGGGS